MDPANPPFFPPILLKHLSHSDAAFVDIIHTDAGLYGQPIATGTADFWPNDGATLQRGCPFRLGIPLTKNGTIGSYIYRNVENSYQELLNFYLNFRPL